MTTTRHASDNSFYLELFANSKSYGSFNYPEIEFGSDGAVAFDPEDGAVFVAGPQTGSELDLDRLFKEGRDEAVLAELRALRGFTICTGSVFKRDPATNQPTTTKPLLTLQLLLKGVTAPKGERGSNTPSKLVVKVQVAA